MVLLRRSFGSTARPRLARLLPPRAPPDPPPLDSTPRAPAKGAPLPGGAGGVTKFKGWLVDAKPVKSKAGRVTYPDLQISMAGKDQPADVTLKLVGTDGATAAPLTGKPDLGGEVEFEGIADSFAKDPAFVVTFTAEKAKITGLKVEAPAPAHHTTPRKKS